MFVILINEKGNRTDNPKVPKKHIIPYFAFPLVGVCQCTKDLFGIYLCGNKVVVWVCLP